MMKQCENCLFRAYKHELCGCVANELKHEWTKLLKTIPFFGRFIKVHECQEYMQGDEP